MKKLTPNSLAVLTLRARKRQYLTLIVGIALAIFFMSSMLLSGQSIYYTYRERHQRQMGAQDAVILDAEDVAPETLIESGYAKAVGSLYIIGETEGRETAIAYYDETGGALSCRRAIEGRLPEGEGEIAIERSKLQRLRSEAKVGDTLTLQLKVPDGSGFMPSTVVKEYQLIGILAEQTPYQQFAGYRWSSEDYLNYPGAMVSREERVEAGGRPIVHRLVQFAPLVTFDAFVKYFEDTPYRWKIDSFAFAMFYGADNDTGSPVLIVGVLGAVLVLAACMGIVGAFSTTLTERRSQIGMLRAVGATQRQIRRIFGREALLIALITAPASIALAHLAVWGLVRALGGEFQFHAEAWFLPLELAFSIAAILAAASIPLAKASRISPMQAIRDTGILRAKKHLRVKPAGAFWPPSLLARRHLKLYRTKQVGTTAVVALSFLILTIGFYLAWLGGIGYTLDADFIIYLNTFTNDWVEEGALKPRLTESDLMEAASLPLVADIQAGKYIRINILTDRVGEYLTGRGGINGPYAYLLAEVRAAEDDKIWWDAKRERYLALRSSQNIEKELVAAPMNAFSEAMIEQLKPYVLSGSVDIDALNEGREVLLVAPERIYYTYITDASGNLISIGFTSSPEPGEKYDMVLENDLFRAGDTLELCRLYTVGESSDGLSDYSIFTDLKRVDKTVRIGALLGADYSSALSISIFFDWEEAGPLITTVAGLNALGFETAAYVEMAITLSDTPDADTEKILEDALTDISNRAEDMTFSSNLKSLRESRQWTITLISCVLAILLLFFSISVSMVNNAVTGRLRSDVRAIGTLRAVGAPLAVILSSYFRQVTAMLAWGVTAGLLLSGAFIAYLYFLPYEAVPDGMLWPLAGLCALFVLLILFFCGLNLRARLKKIVKSSIVDNIREL